MADGYEWILKIKDQFSAPIKGMVSEASKLQSNLAKNTNGVHQMTNSIGGLRSKIEQLKAARDGSFRTDHIKKYNKLIEETEKKLNKLEGLPSQKHSKNWMNVATGINQSLELVSKAADYLSFTKEIEQSRADFQRLGLAGDELDNVTKKSFLLSERFNKDQESIRKAATSMTASLGGSYEENLDLLEQGLLKGGDLNGEMLRSMHEYSGFINNIGLTGDKALAFMIEANKKGIFQDKAFDSLKEGNLALNEMGKIQKEALAGLGLVPEQLKDKTLFESMQLVAQSMEGASDQAKQLAIADIFKGAGEDAVGMFDILKDFKTELSEIESVSPPGDALNSFFAKIKFGISSTVGNMVPWVEGLGQAGLAVTGITQLTSALKKQGIVTKASAIAQKGLNFVMRLNPIGLVITGISLLVGGLVLAYNKIGWFKDAVDGAWGGLKTLGAVIKENVIKSFKTLLEGLSGIGKAFKLLFKGEFSEAIGVGKDAISKMGEGLVGVSPVGMITASVKRGKDIGKAFKKGYKKEVNEIDDNKIDDNDNKIETPNISIPQPVDITRATQTADAIITGGRQQKIINVNIEKVLEMRDQVITEGKEQADELVDTLLEALTRRLSGTFRAVGN